jgi:hypothetical protein
MKNVIDRRPEGLLGRICDKARKEGIWAEQVCGEIFATCTPAQTERLKEIMNEEIRCEERRCTPVQV